MSLCLRVLVVLCVVSVGCADFKKEEDAFCERNPANCGEQPVPSGPASLVFSSVPQTVQVDSCSAVTTVELRDTQGRPVNATAATVVELSVSPADGVQFFTQAGCSGTAVTSVTISASSSSASFYFKGTRVGAATLTAAAGTFSGNQGVTITPGPPATLAVTLPASPVMAGTCLSGGLIQVKDAAGLDSRVSVDTPVSLQVAPASSIAFYADAACTTAVTSVTVTANSGSAPFFIQAQVTGTLTVTASATGLTSGSENVTAVPGAGNRLVFRSPARAVAAGVCSQGVQVQSQDAQGNASPVNVATSISLSATPGTGFKFYSDVGCTTEVASISLTTGASDASFYFKGTQAGSVSVTVISPGFTGSAQTETVNPGSPAIIAFGGPQTVPASNCSAAVAVSLQDAFGNPATASANTTINLTVGGGSLSFFSNSTCTTSATSVSVAQGSGSRDFFVRGTQAGNYTVTASGTGLTSGMVSVTVTPGPASVLAFTTGPQTVQAGACSGVATVQLRDASANPVSVATAMTVNLSVSPSQGFQFFTVPTCTGAAGTTTSIAAGSSSASFYFKSTKTVTGATLTAAVNTITVNQSVTITAAPPSVLAFTVLPVTAAAASCMQGTLQAQDSFGNPSTVSSTQLVTLEANPTDGFTFYTGTFCGVTTNQVTVASGQNSVSFSAKGTKAGTVSLRTNSPGLSDANGSVTITALAVNKVAFTTPPRSVAAGVCSPITTVQSADPYNNATPVSAAEAVTLSGTGAAADAQFKFYSDANCATVITSITIPTGQSTASFYFRGEKARAVTVTANAANLADATQDQTVIGASATNLVFSATTPPNPMLAGTCALRTVESVDTYGNPATNALTLTLSASALAEFFSNSSCTTPITEIALPTGTSSASFYFKGYTGGINAAATLTLTAASTPPLSATQTEFINPTVRTGTCNIGASNSIASGIITPALTNLNKAFLVFQATNAATDSGGSNVRCYLISTSQVRCERADNNGGVANIQWSVAEFPMGVNVQHQAVNCANDTTPVTLSAVVRDNTFLLLSSRRDDATQGTTVPRLAELTTTTGAEIRKTGGCVGTDANALQAVEYTGAFVQRSAETALASNATSKDVSLSPAVVANRSIVLYSYLNDGSGISICSRSLRGELVGSSTLRFSRAEGVTANNCASSNFNAISWEVVQFPVGTLVQQVTHQLAPGSASAPVTLPTPVDASRTIVFMGGQGASGQSNGESRHSASEIIGEMRAQAALNAQGTTVTLTRDSSISSATFTVYVVQLKP